MIITYDYFVFVSMTPYRCIKICYKFSMFYNGQDTIIIYTTEDGMAKIETTFD